MAVFKRAPSENWFGDILDVVNTEVGSAGLFIIVAVIVIVVFKPGGGCSCSSDDGWHIELDFTDDGSWHD